MPSGARRRDVCVPLSARERASAQEGGWVMLCPWPSDAGQILFRNLPIVPSCAPAPAHHMLPRDVCSGARADLTSLIHRPPPTPTHGRTSTQQATTILTACHPTSRQGDNASTAKIR